MAGPGCKGRAVRHVPGLPESTKSSLFKSFLARNELLAPGFG